MRWILAIIGLLVCILPAQARHRHHRYAYHRSWGDCSEAAAKGGPCGCIAMQIVGLTDRKFWLVRNWAAFPRTSPHPGAAAIWPWRHVEIVSSVNGDGTISTQGSVGFSHVSIHRLLFVNPQRGRWLGL